MSHKRHASRLKNKRDANEKELVDFWNVTGCLCIKMPAGAGFDLMVLDGRRNHIVEVKNPEYNWTLTEEEKIMKELVESRGGEYHIIETLQHAADLIGFELDE